MISVLCVLLCIAPLEARAEDPTLNREPAALSSGTTVLNAPQEVLEQDDGVEVTGYYIAEFIRNFSGGQKVGSAYIGSVGLRADFDLQRSLHWNGFTAALYGLGMHGDFPSTNLVGDLQATSNLQGRVETARLFEAWIQKSFLNDKASVLFGLYDLNTEFYLTESSGIFFNSSFGVAYELGQTGSIGPSSFPETSLTLRLRSEFGDDFYVEGAVIDAVPGEPGHDYGTHISVRDEDGALALFEIGKKHQDETDGPVQRYAIGGWQYTTLVDGHRNQGLYVLLNQPLCDHVQAFARYGIATETVNDVQGSYGAGVVFEGLLNHRREDEFGLAIAGLQNSSGKPDPESENETTLEATYKVNWSKDIFVQPDIQYVIHPSVAPSTRNALVGALRIRVGF